MGLPKLLTEADVYAEYPTDIDDEYVTEKGFQTTLPGEYTKISSALALFRVSRILSKVLEKNYPAAASHDLSLSSIGGLEAELKEWSAALPNHLKLRFIQDKPSTDVTGDRSPLLVSNHLGCILGIDNTLTLPVTCVLLYSNPDSSSSDWILSIQEFLIICHGVS